MTLTQLLCAACLIPIAAIAVCMALAARVRRTRQGDEDGMVG